MLPEYDEWWIQTRVKKAKIPRNGMGNGWLDDMMRSKDGTMKDETGPDRNKRLYQSTASVQSCQTRCASRRATYAAEDLPKKGIMQRLGPP